MLRLLDGATQLKGRKRTRDRCDRGTNAGNVKPSYRKERVLGELETIMK
jgi:hypothetical protein